MSVITVCSHGGYLIFNEYVIFVQHEVLWVLRVVVVKGSFISGTLNSLVLGLEPIVLNPNLAFQNQISREAIFLTKKIKY